MPASTTGSATGSPTRSATGSVPRSATGSEVDELCDRVRRVRAASAWNLYDEADATAAGDRPGAATARMAALRDYLLAHWDAPVVLVGEAPGTHGARLTGVPFTSPRILHGSGPAESSATVVHRTLADLGAADEVLLWNASVLYRRDNRVPLADALAASRDVLGLVTRGRTVYAVGRVAARATGAPYLRHPSYGGSRDFARGLALVLRSPPGTDVAGALAAPGAGLPGDTTR